VASVAATSIPRGASSVQRRLLTRPIQEIQVGHRVLAENPELRGQDVPETHFDAESTRLVVLHQIKPDGYELTVETLLPLEVLVATVAERLESESAPPPNPLPLVGSAETVLLNELLLGQTLDLNLPELGAEGPAQIVSIRPCPSFEPDGGTGRRLVTSVFRHAAANVIDLETTGSTTPIGVTANHPFWSEDRQSFIPAGDLQPGERLRQADGTSTRVARLTPRTGPPVPVFNFEVDGQHVYSVGVAGVLVHNSCLNSGGSFSSLNKLKETGEVAHHMPQNAARIVPLGRGPALGMTQADHALTRSFRGRGVISNAADAGLTPMQRLSNDIDDIRTLFGDKYDKGIQEMLAYAKTLPEFY
jgi:hypothetical protein